MLFNSFEFVAFFVITLGVVVLLRRRVTARNIYLLFASYFFYGLWDWRFLGLIAISTVVDYTCGLLLHRKERGGGDDRRPTTTDNLTLAVSVITNLGILGVFKYYNFFIASFSTMIEGIGINNSFSTLHIILPVGISFYTFQTLSYTIDCYRGKIPAEHSFLNFALFVAFFPQLVAGPIERASHLLPQMQKPSVISWKNLRSGLFLMGIGLFKKVVIADNFAPFADAVYTANDPTGLDILVGTYAFAIQIYCDFSGYSDIARGAARCMGFDLMLNFRAPYLATNPSDFWKRWHISLSTWLRDYLYIPLGGNKGSRINNYRNLMLTMILGGIWHGAAWNFVLWGIYQGSLLCIYRLAKERWQLKPPKRFSLHYWVMTVLFFQLVCYGWLLFRAESLEQILLFTSTLTSGALNGINLISDTAQVGLLVTIVVGLAFWIQQENESDTEIILNKPIFVRALVYTFLFFGFIILGRFSGESFIYFQF